MIYLKTTGVMSVQNYKKFERSINDLKLFLKKFKASHINNYAKIISLSYLTVESEKIFNNPENNKPIKDIISIIANTKILFISLSAFSNFQDDNQFKKEMNKDFKNFHKNLWQDIWPNYNNLKQFKDLIEYRGKRIDFNNVKSEFKNKSFIDFGCGNGSTAFSFLLRGAKKAHLIDFGQKNILAAKKWAKLLKLKNLTFEVADIINYKSKKKYDFVICSAVLHHLKTKKEMQKTLNNIAKVCNKNAFFYVFVRGKGGIRYAIQDLCKDVIGKVDNSFIEKILLDLNLSRSKITHLVDWHKAIYLQCSEKEFENMLIKSGFKKFKRLKGPHKNDSDINQIKKHKYSHIKFGTGELRYLAQYG